MLPLAELIVPLGQGRCLLLDHSVPLGEGRRPLGQILLLQAERRGLLLLDPPLFVQALLQRLDGLLSLGAALVQAAAQLNQLPLERGELVGLSLHRVLAHADLGLELLDAALGQRPRLRGLQQGPLQLGLLVAVDQRPLLLRAARVDEPSQPIAALVRVQASGTDDVL